MYSNLWKSQKYWKSFIFDCILITSRHRPHTWRGSCQWRQWGRWGHRRWSTGLSQCWTPEQSRIKIQIQFKVFTSKHSPGKAAERAHRLSKIRLFHPDKTQLMMFQMLFWKQSVSNLYLCAIKSLGILPKLQKNAWNCSDIKQIFSFHLNLSKYYEHFLLGLPIFSKYFLSIIWGEAFDESPQVRLKAVGEVVNDSHLREWWNIDPFLDQENIICNVIQKFYVYQECMLFTFHLPVRFYKPSIFPVVFPVYSR